MRTVQQSKSNSIRREREEKEMNVSMGICLALDKFFNEVPYSLEWGKARNGRLGVIITYTDFMSEALVKNILRDIIPSEVHFVLKREYSDAAIAKILLEEYKHNRSAMVDCFNGSLVTEPIRIFVNRKLDAVEMIEV